MKKTVYSNYARHYFRFYARFPEIEKFRCKADEEGYKAAGRAFDLLDTQDKDLLYPLYASADTLTDAVYEEAKKQGIEQNVIWKKIKHLESLFAKERGLV